MSALLRVLAAVAVLLIAVGAELVSSKLRIMQINARAHGWVAGENPAFEGKTLEDVIALLARSSSAAPASATEAEAEDAADEATASASASSLIQISSQQQHADDDLPAEFDPRVSHPACLAGVFDQGRCGSCWVVAALHSWTDRACIAAQRSAKSGVAPHHLKLSELDITSHTNGCKGGSAADAFKFLVEHGVVTAACQPYGVWERPIAGPIPTCEKQPCLPATFVDTPEPTEQCVGGSGLTYEDSKVKLAGYSWVQGEREMREQIARNGPVVAWFKVFDDFLHYKSGVYSPTSDKFLGNHIVKLVGYGVENGKKYWLLQNSWTTAWGDNGYFKIERGVNACDIEGLTYFAVLEKDTRDKAVAL